MYYNRKIKGFATSVFYISSNYLAPVCQTWIFSLIKSQTSENLIKYDKSFCIKILVSKFIDFMNLKGPLQWNSPIANSPVNSSKNLKRDYSLSKVIIEIRFSLSECRQREFLKIVFLLFMYLKNLYKLWNSICRKFIIFLKILKIWRDSFEKDKLTALEVYIFMVETVFE